MVGSKPIRPNNVRKAVAVKVTDQRLGFNRNAGWATLSSTALALVYLPIGRH